MEQKGSLTREGWLARFAAARAALMDADRVLAVRERLAAHGSDEALLLGDQLAVASARRVGVFAGSFNPQTVAHAAVAEAARVARRLDGVIWAMARVTVDKEQVARATLADRVVQLEAYCRATGSDGVAVLNAGLYADQAEAVRRLVGAESEIWLIVGFDKIEQIFDARYYRDRDAALERLFASAGLLVAPRAGRDATDLAELLAVPGNARFAERVNYVPVSLDMAGIASTAGRLRLRDTPEDGAFEALGGVLTPEGAALGAATDAYRAAERLASGTRIDRYELRHVWLDALEALPADERRMLSLGRLVARAASDDERGRALRGWLEADRSVAPLEEVRRVVASDI